MKNNALLKSDNNIVKKIKEMIKISDYIRKYLPLQYKAQDSFLGLCPFHHEKTPSFTVNDTKGFFYCFGCHEHGDVFSFLQKINNAQFIDVLKDLAKECSLDLNNLENLPDHEKKEMRIALNKITLIAHKRLLLSNKIIEYLYLRGVKDESIKRFQLGFLDEVVLKSVDPKFAAQLGLREFDRRIKNRLFFPIFNKILLDKLEDQDNIIPLDIVGYGAREIENKEEIIDENKYSTTQASFGKYINSPESILFDKKKVLYGLDKKAIDKKSIDGKRLDKTILLVEGYLDAIMIDQETPFIAYASLGTAISQYQIKLLWQKTKYPILCLDGDEAGLKATLRACLTCLEIMDYTCGMKICLLPKNQDPGSLCSVSKETFIDCVRNAISLSNFLFLQAKPIEINSDSILECKVKLKEWLDLIKDRTVKNVFKREWSAQFSVLLSELEKKAKNNLYLEQKTNNNKFIFKKSNEKQIMLEANNYINLSQETNTNAVLAFLLLLLIKFPRLINQVLDEFVNIEFEDPLKIMQSKMIELSVNNIEEMTLENKFPEELINSCIVMQQQLNQKIPEKIEEAKNIWSNLYTWLIQKKYKAELQNVQLNLKDNFDQKNWDRLVELQKLLAKK